MTPESRSTTDRNRTAAWIRRVALGLAFTAAVLGPSVQPAAAGVAPVGGGAKTPTTVPAEQCVNIVTCRSGKLPAEKADPGPSRSGVEAVPVPEVGFSRRRHFATSEGHVVHFWLDVANWEDYDDSMFVRRNRYSLCGGGMGGFRTLVEFVDADADRLLDRDCRTSSAGDIRELFFHTALGAAPDRVVVRLIDRETQRVVTSEPVTIPTTWRVTTSYTAEERPHLVSAAEHWGIRRNELQKAGAMALRFLHGISGTTGSDPYRPRPEVTGPISYTSTWTGDEYRALDWVSRYYDLSYAQTQKLGTVLMVFFAALEQR